jgi:hypothetical protein
MGLRKMKHPKVTNLYILLEAGIQSEDVTLFSLLKSNETE